MATNGLLKDKDQPGIHVGTDGIISYHALGENHRMRGPDQIGEYDIYLTIPGELQRKHKVVCKYDSCISEAECIEREYDGEEIEAARSGEGWIVMRTGLEPKTDPLARAKVEVIHEGIVKFIQGGGKLNEIESFARELEDALEGVQPEEIAKRLGKAVEDVSPPKRTSSAAIAELEAAPAAEEGPRNIMKRNEQMAQAIRRKFNEYFARLETAEQDAAFMAPELRAGVDSELRDALYKANIAGDLMSGQADREEIILRMKALRSDFDEAQFDNAWKVLDAYNRNDLSHIRGGSGLGSSYNPSEGIARSDAQEVTREERAAATKLKAEAGPDKSFRKASTVNGTEISVGWDRGYDDYTIYFPGLELGEKAYERGVSDQVLRLTRRPEVAEMIYDKAVELAKKTTDVYELYKQIEAFSRDLPYDEE